MITFNRLARTKQYARANEMCNVRMTDAMQMVAERETPTRQWTSVAMFLRRPCSALMLVSLGLV